MTSHHSNWQTTTVLTCTNGHPIHVTWTLPNATLEVDCCPDFKAEVRAESCSVTYDGAEVVERRLVCALCGADVPAPAFEALMAAREKCEEEEEHPD